jgi:hypothetical protein
MKQDKETITVWIDKIQEEGRGLSKWEQDFVQSVSNQFCERGSISDRQEEILERIYAEKTP